jgi:hypothetical protein
MKTCPKCHRDYRDDTLRFCLEDGVPLIGAADTRPQGRDSDPPPTAVMYSPAATVKSSGPTAPGYSPYLGDDSRSQRDPRQSNPLLTVGVVAIAVLLLALVCIAAFFVLRQPATRLRPESTTQNRRRRLLGKVIPLR